MWDLKFIRFRAVQGLEFKLPIFHKRFRVTRMRSLHNSGEIKPVRGELKCSINAGKKGISVNSSSSALNVGNLTKAQSDCSSM